MLKEIHEQPQVVRACLTAFLPDFASTATHPFDLNLPAELYSLEQIHLVACGTSLHASLVGQYLLEQIAEIPTRVRCASEYRYAPLPMATNTLTIGVTQSGETADTLEALEVEHQRQTKRAIHKRSQFLGITNRPASSLEKLVDHTLHTPAGQEVGVAATKTFVAQLLAFYCLALDLAYRRQTLSPQQLEHILIDLQQLPDKIQMILDQQQQIAAIAQKFAQAQSCIFLGRGINRAIALEGALKLKETTYIHAEGYAAGEFMHGPIAMLDAQMPVVAVLPGREQADVAQSKVSRVLAETSTTYQKTLANAQKVKSYSAYSIAVTSQPYDLEVADFDDLLPVPDVDELLSPILNIIPLQLLAYYVAVYRGINVDHPRHLTKALTVN